MERHSPARTRSKDLADYTKQFHRRETTVRDGAIALNLSEEDFERLILDYVAAHPGIAGEVGWAVKSTYRTITGAEM